MRFVSLTIRQGFFQNEFLFPSPVNLIHSKKNSVGKTTLLRFLMYALGYAIPSIRGLNFDNYELVLVVQSDNGKICDLIRNKSSLIYKCDGEEINFSLPSDLLELHQLVFGIENYEVLDNILGAFYIDQEKGWTLLNRGKAIGNIRFNLESLLRGLSNRSNDELAIRLVAVKRELQKYRQMLDVAEYQAELNASGENIAFDAQIDEIESAIDSLSSERKPLAYELDRVKNVIRKNTSFKKYIASMQLRVMSTSGEEVPVNEDTLIDFRDNAEYLIAKRRMIEIELASIDRKIDTLRKQQNKENALYDIQTSIQAFDADVSKMKIDAIITRRVVSRLENERRGLEEMITNSVKSNNPIVGELHSLISSYAQEMGVDEKYVRPTTDYIFTSDLKSLTGAIFHKIVFSFKISYIKIIEKYTKVRLPIVLDSPSGREIDKINISDMMGILARDFADHQIIIASIYEYDFPDVTKIEISGRLLS